MAGIRERRKTVSSGTLVWATEQVVGYHCWPEAPKEDRIEYLRSPHRHVFKITVFVGVTNDDRQVEFHVLKRAIRSRGLAQFATNEFGEYDFGYSSCEAIARTIMDNVGFDGVRAVEVSEDGETGARVFK
jgi:hypothetical protein